MADLIQLHDLQFQPFISAEQIARRIAELGQSLSKDLEGKNPLFIAVLNGAYVFTADLLRAFEGNCDVSFVKLASYQGVSSTGKINTLIGLNNELKGRHVVLVEDIVDSGLTMKNLRIQVLEKAPASVTIVSLLVKPEELQVPLDLPYVGFEIPPLFVVGYGMDYNEHGRNLPDIWQLKPS
ncbi:MAG: hypoxanthine phosphoribosyltransferase [Bacteroidetes bacterium]|nr:hypoxanthine phosphoribosyltransferase [Bacteroidota bacterium]